MLSPLGRLVSPSLQIAVLVLLAAGTLQICRDGIAYGRQSGDRVRGLWEKTFESARPGKRKNRKRPSVSRETRIANALIGVTIWRMRSPEPQKTSSDKPRSLEHKPETSPSNLVAERVETNTLFREGEFIRIGIEVPRNGFLYVIDREVYEDGTLGDPLLIFPTKDLRGGDNRVYPGRLIEIPAQTDDPPHFTLKRSRKDQVGEKLTLIVSPFRLAIESRHPGARLERSQVTRWENLWGSSNNHREASSNVGNLRTRAEQEAVEGKRLLARGDALPQTIFRARVRAGSPLLITFPLKIEP
jgi:hypothetical protein